jgi:hypothetical protein
LLGHLPDLLLVEVPLRSHLLEDPLIDVVLFLGHPFISSQLLLYLEPLLLLDHEGLLSSSLFKVLFGLDVSLVFLVSLGLEVFVNFKVTLLSHEFGYFLLL